MYPPFFVTSCVQVFFRAGVLGNLENLRDVQMGIVLTAFQTRCRGYLMRKLYRKLLDQRYKKQINNFCR